MSRTIDPQRAGRFDRLAPQGADPASYRIDDRTWADLDSSRS